MPKTPDGVELLERAAEALDASKPAAALAPLLAAWEKVRSPELAGLVERVSALAGGKAPFPGKTAKARHEAWLALGTARSPNDVERLLEGLVDGVKSREAAERLEALGAFAPDPRIAKALVAIARHPPFQSQSSKPFWKKLFQLLVMLGDPRTIDVLGPLAATYDVHVARQEVMGEYMKKQLERALADLRERYASPPAFPEAASAVFRRLAALVVPAPSPEVLTAARTEHDLLAAIAAAPDEDGPRLVYADFLHEQENPRGEFITLQFQRGRAGGLSRKEEAREAALLATHKRDWLGPFYEPLKRAHVRFRRGFLAVAPFSPRPVDIEHCAGDVRWTTVEELFLYWAHFSHAPLFEAPVFGALRTLRGAALDVVATLLRTGVAPRLETLHCSLLDRGAAEGLVALSHLRSLVVAPVAAEPNLNPHDYAWMLELAVMDQLRRFDVVVDPSDKTLAPLAVASDARPDLALDVRYATLVFARGAEGRRSALELEVEPDAHQKTLVARYAPVLESIPASSIRRVRVTGAARGTRAALAQLLARFDQAEIVFG
jgi:uncharacterized protein (TIGR02996 family)